MLATIGRMLWVPVAFVLSGLVCAFVIVTLGLERLTNFAKGLGDPDMNVAGSVELLQAAFYLSQAFTLLPAIAMVLIGEIAGIRSVYYYIVAGGLAAAAVPLLARIGLDGLDGPMVMPAVVIWQIFATGGFIAGFTYWLLAGRTA